MSEQFWVTGGDGREYGPVPLETLTRWISEKRVLATTRVRTETSGWAEAYQRPELAAFFAASSAAPGTTPAAGAPPAAAPAVGGAQPAWPVGLPTEFRVWDFMGRAWDLVKPHWLPLAGIFFIQVAISCVPYLGSCAQFIIGGAIAVGIWRAILCTVDGRKPSVGMMFEGFDRFGDAFLAFLVMLILTALGLALLIVPGIILALMWMFTFAVLGETRLGFWEAMHQSAVLTEGYRWRLFLLALACIPIIILGFVALCLGIFVALPVCYTAFGLAYRFLQVRKGWRPAAS
jgi:uncharacterized membrane protein